MRTRRNKAELLNDLIIEVRQLVISGTSLEWVEEYGTMLNDEVQQYYNDGMRSAKQVAKIIIDDYQNSHGQPN